jgi:hypothetical protein
LWGSALHSVCLLPSSPSETSNSSRATMKCSPLPCSKFLCLRTEARYHPSLNQSPHLVYTTSEYISPLPLLFPWPYLEEYRLKTSLPSSCLGPSPHSALLPGEGRLNKS